MQPKYTTVRIPVYPGLLPTKPKFRVGQKVLTECGLARILSAEWVKPNFSMQGGESNHDKAGRFIGLWYYRFRPLNHPFAEPSGDSEELIRKGP